MNEIFVRLYLDEDVDVLIAKMIRSENFAAISTDEAGRKGKSDADQLSFAATHQYAIVTHNRYDYEKLAQSYFEKNHDHCGIIIAVQRSPREIANAILKILDTHSADQIKNQILYI
ncbi:MAG: DUF5615 family PIN-like protein [Pyrinomonadaceae bacterium]|nr:DUF5615 family PIN-like protein [Pyrinomonadaceae bacterium]